MFCPHCGKPLADGARFCGNCGATIAGATPPASPAIAPPPPPSASPVPPPPPPAYTPAAAAEPYTPPPPPAYAPPPSPPHAPPPSPAQAPGEAAPAHTPPPAPAYGAPSSTTASTASPGAAAGVDPFAGTAAATQGAPAGAFATPGNFAAPGANPYVTPGAMPPPGAALGGLIGRVKGILLAPRTEWPLIAAEPRSARDIYLGYVAPMAAIGVIASLIGKTLIGVTVPLLGTVREPILGALVGALLAYAMAFVSVFLVALIVNALAPTFGGQKDSVRALKVTAYSFTAGWVAGVVAVIPMLGLIAVLGGLYGLYLLYLGLPVLMRSPPDKAVGYTVVTVLCAIVLGVITSLVTGALVAAFGLGSMAMMSRAAPSPAAGNDVAAAVVSKMMGGQSGSDQARMKDALTQLQKMGEQAEKAERQAKATGADPGAAAAGAVDMSAALGAVGTMMAGGRDVKPVDFHALKDMLPASLPGLARSEASGQSGEAMGMKGSSATARYADGADASITIEIADLGSLSGIAGLAAQFDPKMEKETNTGYERTRNVSGQLVHEQYDRQAKGGETSVLVGGRFNVTVRGHGVDPSQLTGALQAVDLARLPSLVAAK